MKGAFMGMPLIGITTSHDVQEKAYFLKYSYAESIVRAGGLPVLLPADEAIGREAEYAAAVDGILFAGGGDIHPKYFGEEPLEGFESGSILPQRDSFEIRLYQEGERRRIPMLGICRGIQVMAAATGGSICQDIDTGMKRVQRIRHMQKAPDWCETHAVKLVSETKLAGIYGTEQIMTNSFHHQAVKRVPEGYRVNAWSADGVIEGMESLSLAFCIGVQWHPERTSARDERTAELFRIFVKYAALYGARKYTGKRNVSIP